jgi:hypothetical protein
VPWCRWCPAPSGGRTPAAPLYARPEWKRAGSTECKSRSGRDRRDQLGRAGHAAREAPQRRRIRRGRREVRGGRGEQAGRARWRRARASAHGPGALGRQRAAGRARVFARRARAGRSRRPRRYRVQRRIADRSRQPRYGSRRGRRGCLPGVACHRDDRVIDGFHVYRGTQLPAPDQVITVETALSPVAPIPVQSCRARVTHVIPGDTFPVRAIELEP